MARCDMTSDRLRQIFCDALTQTGALARSGDDGGGLGIYWRHRGRSVRHSWLSRKHAATRGGRKNMKYKPNPISHTPQISNINVGHPRCRSGVTPVMLFMSIDQRGSMLRNA